MGDSMGCKKFPQTLNFVNILCGYDVFFIFHIFLIMTFIVLIER